MLTKVVAGDYGSAMRDAIDPGSEFRGHDLDEALIALDQRMLRLDRARASVAEAGEAVAAALTGNVRGSIIAASVVPPAEAAFDSLDTI